MIESALTFIQSTLIPLGAWGVFAAALAEEVIAPLPSALVIMLAGLAFLKGPFTLALLFKLIFVIVIPSAFGIALGSLPIFFIGYFVGKPFFMKWGWLLGLSWTDVEKLQMKFSEKKTDEWAIFILRSIPFMPSVAVSAFCGLIRYNIKKYLVLSFFGVCIRSFILAIVGWQFGALYYQYADAISHVEDIVLWTIVILIATFFLYKILRKAKQSTV